jgi:hypothetical protein
MELAEEMALETDENTLDMDCRTCTMSLKKLSIELKISSIGARATFICGGAAALTIENPTRATNTNDNTE